MKKYLLPKEGQFYKANLHCHTNVSDGAKSPKEVKELYQKLGYSVIAYTDHDILLGHDDLTDDQFLALHGFEIEITQGGGLGAGLRNKTCHLCFVALEPDNLIQPFFHRTKYVGYNDAYRSQIQIDESEPDFERSYDQECVNTVIRIAREKGFFVTYNHPTWSLEKYPDYIGYTGMNAMEIFNGSCLAGGLEEYNPRVYDDFLAKGTRLYCIGADDNHNAHPDFSVRSDAGRAYIAIKAPNLEYRTITKALEEGHFYAAEGPDGPSIHELWVEDDRVYVKTSAARQIQCIHESRAGGIEIHEDGSLVTEASFPISRELGYFRILVVDEHGKRATTNAYFPEELCSPKAE